MAEQPSNEAMWRAILSGELPAIRRGRHLYRLLPSNPRCKLCNAPFGAPGAPLMRMLGRGQWAKNPRICEF
jgi:adenylate cyclase